MPRQHAAPRQRLSTEAAQHTLDAADKIIFSNKKKRDGISKKASPMLSPGQVRLASPASHVVHFASALKCLHSVRHSFQTAEHAQQIFSLSYTLTGTKLVFSSQHKSSLQTGERSQWNHRGLHVSHACVFKLQLELQQFEW